MRLAPRHTERRSSSSSQAADIAGSRRRGRHLDHRSGWGKADHDPDAGSARSAARISAPAQRKGRIDRRLMEASWRGLPANTSLRAEQATGRAWAYLDGRQHLPAFFARGATTMADCYSVMTSTILPRTWPRSSRS
jgi:hypothetical protein